GTILINQNRSHLETTLGGEGIPKSQADQIAEALSSSAGGSETAFAEHGGAKAQQIFAAVQHDFALSTQTVFYCMAGVLAIAFFVALKWMPPGKVEPDDQTPSQSA